MVYRGWGSALQHPRFLPDLVPKSPWREIVRTTPRGEAMHGVSGFDLHYGVSKKFSIGLGAGYLFRTEPVWIPDNRRPDQSAANFSIYERSMFLTASIRHQWFTGSSTIYSGLQVGFWDLRRWSPRDDIMDRLDGHFMTGQLTAIGYRMGGALAVHVELGYGHKGIGVFSVSYAFNAMNYPEPDR